MADVVETGQAPAEAELVDDSGCGVCSTPVTGSTQDEVVGTPDGPIELLAVSTAPELDVIRSPTDVLPDPSVVDDGNVIGKLVVLSARPVADDDILAATSSALDVVPAYGEA